MNTMKRVGLMTVLITFIILWAALPYIVQAGEHHNQDQNDANTTIIHNTMVIIPQTFTQRVYENSRTAALAISAARCDFGDAGRSLQVCVGLGQYRESVGATVGAGMLINDVLWNGSLSAEDGETAVGLGWTWHVR